VWHKVIHYLTIVFPSYTFAKFVYNWSSYNLARPLIAKWLTLLPLLYLMFRILSLHGMIFSLCPNCRVQYPKKSPTMFKHSRTHIYSVCAKLHCVRGHSISIILNYFPKFSIRNICEGHSTSFYTPTEIRIMMCKLSKLE
jgi:hypothetical protein